MGAVPSLTPRIFTDVAATKLAAQAVSDQLQQHVASGILCAAVDRVGSDAVQVLADTQTTHPASTVEQQVTAIRGAMSSLMAASSKLQTDESTFLTYSAPAAPSPAQVTQVVGQARQSLYSAVSSTNGFVEQVNADVTLVYGYVTHAYRGANCGAAPARPSPLHAIS